MVHPIVRRSDVSSWNCGREPPAARGDMAGGCGGSSNFGCRNASGGMPARVRWGPVTFLRTRALAGCDVAGVCVLCGPRVSCRRVAARRWAVGCLSAAIARAPLHAMACLLDVCCGARSGGIISARSRVLACLQCRSSARGALLLVAVVDAAGRHNVSDLAAA